MNSQSLCPTTKSLIGKLKPCALILALGLLLTGPLSGAESDPASATQADSGSDPRILPDLEQERLQALANSQLPDTQTLWLETPHESFLGLFKPANSPSAKGAVLLLHHDRTSADWPGSITTLRQGLPDQGWHTLSIALPDAPEYIPPRTEDVVLAELGNSASGASPGTPQTAPATAAEAEDKLQAHFDQISARIESGLRYLDQQQPPRVLILGEGSGAYWALRYSVGPGQDRPLLPILIDTVAPTTATTPTLIELIAQLQRPTLDLYHGNGLGQNPIEVLALQRRNAAKRQGKGLLLSSRMSSRAGDWRQPDKRLLGVMRGMLQRLLAATPRGRLEAKSNTQQIPGMY
ncbi:MAG: DUF3530 family protein [Motiliproteus sp.]